ncbi:mitochondrial basic amino acids transporter-like [Ostrinia furnacalis]|uniref:mitochondrial basic amino acids transporter-like n=1 Tax=Ostrinia furnacalis TaxID=93504 RepID=UPI001038655E|nr:mitochondrial basic amino acids transporter-like [Ostrinia furnacalis]XP_028162283.1 mitochondrial basic amino acids transporter-like [Ostrinia furnacalis]
MALDFVAGCIGGCAGIIAGHPLDTLKVHVQSGRGSAIECTKALLKGGTLATAYRGVGAPLGGIAVVNAIVFGAYGNTRRSLPNSNSLSAHAIAGSAAGALQSFACAPIELVKTRQQLAQPGEGMPTGAWSGARHIIRTGGIRALFRGLGITIARDSPAFAIYFTSYEVMTRGDQSVARVFTAGGVAGMLSWILLYPIDVVKSRLQGDVVGRYAGAWDCFVKSVRADRWKCMSRGLGAVTLRAFISNGACFTAVAWTERAWQHYAAQASVTPLVRATGISDAMYNDHVERYYDI